MRTGPIAKRAFDVAVALPALLLLAPVLLLTAVAVQLCMGSPVLFRHRRASRRGRPFTLLKFRTMRPSAGNEPDAVRLTRLGALLRACSLDELPQLWNVLRGDMSLVGPRPLLPEYLDRYTHEQARRHAVRPGLTGLAQVSGRNALSWPRKFELDVWYVDHASLALDLRILWRSAHCVLGRRGVAAPGHATMPEFR